MTRANRIAWYTIAAVTVFFMLVPLVILVIFSFSENALIAFPITGFSLRWVYALFDKPGLSTAFQNSLIITVSVGVTATLVGTMTAIGLSQVRSWRANAYLTALTIPIMVPPLMLAIMLLSYFTNWLDMRLGLHTVIMSHLVFTQPFVILIVSARMTTFDFSAVDSARDLGASSLEAFFTVTLPIIRPVVVGAGLIAMALSLDDFVVTFFTIGGGSTLPTFMWGMLRRGVDPTINVIAVLTMCMSIAVSLVGLYITRYRG